MCVLDVRFSATFVAFVHYSIPISEEQTGVCRGRIAYMLVPL
jgi:hypothetical protein